MLQNMNILEKIAVGVEESTTKADMAGPLLAMTDVLNDMYKQGAIGAREKKQALKFVDVDLFVIHLALVTIYNKAWIESTDFDVMKKSLAELVRKLKVDIEAQISTHDKKVVRLEIEA